MVELLRQATNEYPLPSPPPLPARVFGHTTTTMHDTGTPPLPFSYASDPFSTAESPPHLACTKRGYRFHRHPLHAVFFSTPPRPTPRALLCLFSSSPVVPSVPSPSPSPPSPLPPSQIVGSLRRGKGSPVTVSITRRLTASATT